MPAQYAHLDGRRFVNEDFVNDVRDVYPATTKKIPLGYSTYTGWGGKDEVLFTSQEPEPMVAFEGPVFQVTFDPSHPECFEEKILPLVEHATPGALKEGSAGPPVRRRLTGTVELDRVWGSTLEGRLEKVASEREARRGGGLYGYPKMIQTSCEGAMRRLVKKAAAVVTKAAKRDRHVLAFLETHTARGDSMAARVLITAYRDAMPQLPPRKPDPVGGPVDFPKMAGRVRLGLYGYPAKTAKLGLTSCTLVREGAGVIAADLHRRKGGLHTKITGFLGEHGKTAGSAACNLILCSYPEEGFNFRSRRAAIEGTPTTVDEWLTWDSSSG